MEADRAARALEAALTRSQPAGAPRDLTIADAAAGSGLPLRDAEKGLHALLSEYRGHLRVTEEGELLFRFPNGFTRPWETRTRLQAFAKRAGRALVGFGRFVVRAWISIVLVAYALLFLALMIGLTFARSSDDRDSRSGVGFEVGYVVLRIVSDALFWTFHPFSPFAYSYYDTSWSQPAYGRRRRREGPPFYEKVNRFFFGPEAPPEDPRAMERAILAEIRAQKGRIGLGDVMRVTGLPRDEADPLMSRLMLDYEGTVEVSEEGGIVYRFENLRKTVEAEARTSRPPPAWAKLDRLGPLTGNELGSNLLIAGLNGFNLIMSLYALDGGWTIEKIRLLLAGVPLQKIPESGTAIALGVVPLIFSIALFALPLIRAAVRPLRAKKIAKENGRRGALKAILEGAPRGEVTDEALQKAWRQAAGEDPDPKELTREVAALGGDVEILDDGRTRYRFPDLEAEAKALAAEREAASEEEAKVGKVIFSSES